MPQFVPAFEEHLLTIKMQGLLLVLAIYLGVLPAFESPEVTIYLAVSLQEASFTWQQKV